MDKPRYWDRHSIADRLEFAKYLDPLVTASRTKTFTKAEASVYLLTLQDVPRDVLAHGVSRLLEQGVTWMPKPGEIKSACADVVDERRAVPARQARALQEDCPDCHGSGWADAEGPNAVAECRCKKRARELMAQADQPIKRLALPEPEPAA